MPEMLFHLTWPDGTAETCYSPSLVIREHFSEGGLYTLDDFLARSRIALGIASERVRAKYGVPCSRAQAQLARIEQAAVSFASQPDPRVRVDRFTL
jgi:uncharacterized repeat protein (TIGR04042 family)